MKKKKGKRLLQLLLTVVAVLGCTAFTEKPVQAAENVNYLDDAAMQDLKNNSFVHADRSRILLDNCFWNGYF